MAGAVVAAVFFCMAPSSPLFFLAGETSGDEGTMVPVRAVVVAGSGLTAVAAAAAAMAASSVLGPVFFCIAPSRLLFFLGEASGVPGTRVGARAAEVAGLAEQAGLPRAVSRLSGAPATRP